MTKLSRAWLQSEIATIERHLQGQPSPTLAALKLALERLDQIGTVKIPTSADEAEMRDGIANVFKTKGIFQPSGTDEGASQ